MALSIRCTASPARPLAVAIDRDDVLFELNDGRLTVVRNGISNLEHKAGAQRMAELHPVCFA